MAFWGGSRLLDEGGAQSIVTPFDPERIDCSAYTLTLGAEAYVTPKRGDDLRQNLKSKLDPATVETIGGQRLNKGGGSIVIPSGQFAFLLTEEIVSLPADVMGFISLKSKPKFGGLINVSGFHVDPGFKGRLIFSVFNAGPSTIHLARGEPLFLLWIADLSGKVDKKFQKTTAGYVNIPSALITEVSRERHSMQELSDRLDEVSKNVDALKTTATIIATVLGLFFALVALKPVLWDSSGALPAAVAGQPSGAAGPASPTTARSETPMPPPKGAANQPAKPGS